MLKHHIITQTNQTSLPTLGAQSFVFPRNFNHNWIESWKTFQTVWFSFTAETNSTGKYFKTGLLWGQKVLTYRNRPVCLRVRVLLVYSDTAAVSLSRQSHQTPLIKTGVLPQRTQKLLVCRCASHRYTTTSRRESGTNINRRGFKVSFSLNLVSFSDFSLLEIEDCFEGKHQHHLLKVGAFTSDRLKKGSVQI